MGHEGGVAGWWAGFSSAGLSGRDFFMSEAPPMLRDPRKADADQLTLLAVFHFVGAGLAGFGMLFLFVHYSIMSAVFNNPQMWNNAQMMKNLPQGPSPEQFFGIFKWFYVFGGAWFVASLGLNVISGFCLLGRKGRMFSMVVAGMNCLHIPLGTVLGVFTIIVLMRDSVREAYGG